MQKSRRLFLMGCAAVGGFTLVPPASAEDLPKPFVVYDDELKNGWQNRSWAKVQLSVPIGGGKPARVEGDPWSGLMLYHDAFSTAGFSKLTFLISGGSEGGQNLMVKISADGKVLDSSYIIRPKAKTWALVDIPLKEIGAENKTLDGIVLQGMGEAYKAYYVTRIQLE